jgi:DNA-binding CsgD family transcriptional regulator
MPSLRAGDYSRVLGLVAESLRCASPEFPDQAVTGLLRDLLQAEFAGAALIDLCGTATRTWADSPQPIPVTAGDFHEYAVHHPLVEAYRHRRQPTVLRLSDVPRATGVTAASYSGSEMSHVLTIPLAITPRSICAIALMRGGRDFTTTDLRLASEVQPVLGALYVLRDRVAPAKSPLGDSGTGISITLRELSVLDLMAEGLIAAAIARRLGISRHTVNRHIESIYRKFGTHDRISAVLRGQALGYLPAFGASSKVLGAAIAARDAGG